MEFLAGLYTLLLVAICLLQALLLHRTGKPAAQQDDEALKEWLRQQLEAQARVLEEKQAQQAQQNLAAMAHISDTLQTAVQGMSSTDLDTAQFCEFSDMVEAYAATELGVTFYDLQGHA